MKRKLLLTTILLIGGLVVSCSSDESGGNKTEDPVVATPSPITITSTSSEFLIIGENLEIIGTNFLNKDYPTKIFINETEVTPKEITNNKILLSAQAGVKAGANSLRIEIDKIKSTTINFFIIEKGWNKLSTIGDYDIYTSNVFDDSNSIFSFIDSNNAENIFNGTPQKLEAKSTGYVASYVGKGGSYGSFKMYNDKIGVITSSTQARYSVDGFETFNEIIPENGFSRDINGLNIASVDSKSSYIYTIMGSQLYTQDNGKTILKNDPPKWAVTVVPNGASIRLNVRAFGKSSSNGKFYQVGRIYDYKKYGSIQKNVLMESETGYSDWIMKDSITNANANLSSIKFLNINKIYGINNTEKSLVVSTDMLQTWTTVKNDVAKFFLRSETQWYIQSGDKIFVTKDSGATWSLELELPTGSVVNEIAFSKNKIIVSGNKGLHYLKIE